MISFAITTFLQCGCLSYNIFLKIHNKQINLYNNIYFTDVWSFIPFNANVFLFPDFHHGAWWRWKHHVKMTPVQFIEIPYLYTAFSLLCLSLCNLKRHYTCTNYHPICSRLFENHKLVLKRFHFLTVCLFFYSKYNPGRQMKLFILMTKYWDILFFFGLIGVKNTVTTTPQRVLHLNTTVQIILEKLSA